MGVDTGERTALVTDGLFAHVRNPVFTAMVTASLGLSLIVPNWVSLVALAALVTAIQLQVRVVEEPYLTTAHGPAYARYTHRTRTLLPGIAAARPRRDCDAAPGAGAQVAHSSRSSSSSRSAAPGSRSGRRPPPTGTVTQKL
ncbi:methyltransferase family protein [Streptomyces sp. NBC_01294]|uniref:methyltransferase family protein n=1 Tax=Streptomyces sp. NBC_01294 TaxID=2903815 RepID=UPI002DDBE867|nr:isoprenylcysteine carboxylmethyltransferase family protein [Streptomyces sp. NBC_01294]WRZ55218.1 isoprenylcysteine carboxylmethyltransferase family protein [Streptomyces sp. NBC_01294]